MESALSVFINGIAGVFAGITFLYIAIRLNSAIAGREVTKED
jgi:Na+-transporting methylmalonyl-CoA/oxaloacetate decarboxylase gamma subunit